MTTTAEQIQSAIATNAVDGIQSASNDSGSVTKMSIDDQIKAANYLSSIQAGRKPSLGLRFTKLVPPGAG